MPDRNAKIDRLRQRVADSAKRRSTHLVGRELNEAGVMDRAVLNRQIAEILDGLPAEPSVAALMERSLEAFLRSLHERDVAKPAGHVCAVLSLQLDDLRKAALLSLMVRLAGKRKFDPIASYILQKQEVFGTARG
jgi:hypothetical protein